MIVDCFFMYVKPKVRARNNKIKIPLSIGKPGGGGPVGGGGGFPPAA